MTEVTKETDHRYGGSAGGFQARSALEVFLLGGPGRDVVVFLPGRCTCGLPGCSDESYWETYPGDGA